MLFHTILVSLFALSRGADTIEDDTYREYCPGNCLAWNDGCNTCYCDPDTGRIQACTEMACFTQGTPYCSQCASNFEWVGATNPNRTCGDPCWKARTCYSNEAIMCMAMCQDQCQCPEDKPIYDCKTDSCIASDECPSEDEWDSGCPNGTATADSSSKDTDMSTTDSGVTSVTAISGTSGKVNVNESVDSVDSVDYYGGSSGAERIGNGALLLCVGLVFGWLLGVMGL